MGLDNLLKVMTKKKQYTLQDLFLILKGGAGSGNFGHAGKLGQRGGSAPKSFAMSITTGRDAARRQQEAAWSKMGGNGFYLGNIKTSTPEDIYNGSSQSIKELADRTGIIATDAVSKKYVEEMAGKFEQKGGGVDVSEIDKLDRYHDYTLNTTTDTFDFNGYRGDRYAGNFTDILNTRDKGSFSPSVQKTLSDLEQYKTKTAGWYGKRMEKALEKLPQDKLDELKEATKIHNFNNSVRSTLNTMSYNNPGMSWDDRRNFGERGSKLSNSYPPNKGETVKDYIKRLATTPEGKNVFSSEKPKYPTKEMIALTNVTGGEREDRKTRIDNSWDNSVHHFGAEVKNVFSIKHQPEVEAAYKAESTKYGNVQRLWHGASTEAARGINSTGFQVTPNPKAGRMLGDGVYLTKKASKSAQYLASSGVTRARGTRGVLLETQSALGKVKNWTEPGWLNSKDADSIFAKKGTTDTGYHAPLLNDEYANYHPKATIPRYWIDMELR